MRIIGLAVVLSVSVAWGQEDVWNKADTNAEQARKAFVASWRYSQGWLQFADAQSGLLPRNLSKDFYWNARDAAADNYPFMVLTAYFTDKPLMNGRLRQILDTEQKLCNRLDRLPDDWLFATQAFRTPEYKLDDLIFGASEYAKDGLLPLTEWLGPSPWSERMLGLLDDIWKHGTIDTEVGKIPAKSHEVAGNLMQACSRMYWMTGNDEFRKRAFQLADYFLLHHPPDETEMLQLADHGCEIIGGLSEVYFLASEKDPAAQAKWRPLIHRMLDRILEVGRTEDGLFVTKINPKTGVKLTQTLTDNWGYNYNAILTVSMVDKTPEYRDAVKHALKRLMNCKDNQWENGSSDGFADSLEGCINLMNRIPTPEAEEWADYTANIMFGKQRDTGVIEGWHGDGNFARTALMYALWKTRGAHLEPWRADLRLGAAVDATGAVCFSVKSDWPWTGKICFDIPRHNEIMKMPQDYPRLNQFPEWFTVPITGAFVSDNGELSAAVLRQGLPLTVTKDSPARLKLLKKAG